VEPVLTNARLPGGPNRRVPTVEKKNNPIKVLLSATLAKPEPGERSDSEVQVAEQKTIVSGVAERYATALFELALEGGHLDAVAADLSRFSALLAESEDLSRLVRSPVFSAEDQLRAVSAVLDKTGLSGLVGNFIKVAANNRRLFAVPGMIVAFSRMLARHRGEVTAEVTSAEPLTDSQVATLKDALKAQIGKDVTLVATVDPALIGGLIVKVGSRMIDTSLRSKLNSLKIAMKEVG
jgi:F-type H+-transporting ATPase subunit delta